MDSVEAKKLIRYSKELALLKRSLDLKLISEEEYRRILKQIKKEYKVYEHRYE